MCIFCHLFYLQNRFAWIRLFPDTGSNSISRNQRHLDHGIQRAIFYETSYTHTRALRWEDTWERVRARVYVVTRTTWRRVVEGEESGTRRWHSSNLSAVLCRLINRLPDYHASRTIVTAASARPSAASRASERSRLRARVRPLCVAKLRLCFIWCTMLSYNSPRKRIRVLKFKLL